MNIDAKAELFTAFIALLVLGTVFIFCGCASPSYSEYRSERQLQAMRLATTQDGLSKGLDLLDTTYWQYWRAYPFAGTVDAGGKVLTAGAAVAAVEWAWDKWGSQHNGNTTTYNGDYVGGDKITVTKTSTETTTEATK